LAEEFSEYVGVETIERFLHSSYDQLAPNATITSSCRCSPSASPANGCAPS
jgi:hypothetical protein